MKKKNRKGALAILLVLCLLLAGCSEAAPENTTEQGAQGVEAVLADLVGLGSDLGYSNALAELTPVSADVSGAYTFYRLQQNYNGIPVYGQQVVYVTDAEGKCRTISHNVRDLEDAPSLTPSVSAELVEKHLYAYIKLELYLEKIQNPLEIDLGNAKLYLLDRTEENYTTGVYLAYEILWNGYQFLVDAHEGRVLCHKQLVQGASAPATLATSGDTFNAFSMSSGTYVFKDADENIFLLDANGRTYWNSITGELHPDVLALVTSPDNVFGDGNDSTDAPETAEEVFRAVRRVRQYYRDNLGAEKVSNLMVVYNDFCGGNGANASGGTVTATGYPHLFPGLDAERDLVGVVSLGVDYAANAGDNLDIIAHEYTHAVSNRIVDWAENNTDNQRLEEAFADILGELVAAQISGQTPDWKIAGRNMQDPASCGMPVTINDSPDIGDTVHDCSTVISHIAYRMWNGMDGTESKKIPTEQLTQLWYKAMLLMPSNADFAICRSIVTEAAGMIDLTGEQMACIQEAFDNAQIFTLENRVHATLDRSFQLQSVSDAEYEVTVADAADFFGPYLPGKDTVTIKAKGACDLTLVPGMYCITIQAEQSYAYLVRVMDGGAAELDPRLTSYVPENFQCRIYACNNSGPIPNAQVSLYEQKTGELVTVMNAGQEGVEATGQAYWGKYVMKVEAEGYRPYETVIQVLPRHTSQHQVGLYRVEDPLPAVYEKTPHFTVPEVVTVQSDMDYGVYPFPKDFILEKFGYEASKLHHVYKTDTYGYEEGKAEDVITSSSPYYWWWGAFDPSVEDQIWDYITLLSQEPFCLELVYTKDMGEEWVYVYRYTGKYTVYPLNISGFVPEDAGEYHLAIDISKRKDHNGRIALEVSAGYGLEAISPEILEDIRHEIGYNRTSNGSEHIEENEMLDSGTCYFCHKTVYATAERPIYNEQIIYCDACYEEMFATE